MFQPYLLHDFIAFWASRAGESIALLYKKEQFDYAALQLRVEATAGGLVQAGLLAGERVAIYLPKQPEAVFGLFGTSLAGGVFVPVNPLLKPNQVAYILEDCSARVLITTNQRLQLLIDSLGDCPALHTIVVTDGESSTTTADVMAQVIGWQEFLVGASAVLMDYLLPRDVLRAISRYHITGLAAVPPLWNQLVPLAWPSEAAQSLRYITNTGGAMPVATTRKLQQLLPNTQIYLMYGLTEAFRSTYLAPDQVDTRPDSIGKAIPNTEILVVREDGSECAPDEPGELVHRGALVAQGYWNDSAKTAERFKPAPGQPAGISTRELAVWSGDRVRRDAEGYFYFISREDEMIKTSGYRVSPTEVEEILYDSPIIGEVAALGLPHAMLGQAILLCVARSSTAQDRGDDPADRRAIMAHCQATLPNFMVPKDVVFLAELPHNQNGKIDRKLLAAQFEHQFQEKTP